MLSGVPHGCRTGQRCHPGTKGTVTTGYGPPGNAIHTGFPTRQRSVSRQPLGLCLHPTRRRTGIVDQERLSLFFENDLLIDIRHESNGITTEKMNSKAPEETADGGLLQRMWNRFRATD